MAIIYVDGKKYNVDESNNLLHACLSVGINIPYFCWHPILGSIGSCRQCAVKKYENLSAEGNIVMSCMTPACDGTIISVEDNESKSFRKNIIELFMNNHPHDCPVCEEGGNCHLQDMTVMVEHQFRQYNFTKRTYKNQYLGPFISHEMNRCIGCYRCLRFYRDYADGTDFGVYGIANNIYFGRLQDGILENNHSGNLVEICPTGVFTDKTYSEHFHRKWDMQYAPSICNYCSIGCNISVGERYGKICRIENRYHNEINHYLICDLGRFGYGYSNMSDRPIQSFYRKNDKIVFLKNDFKAVEKAVELLSSSKRILGIGSNRASIESNFSLYKIVGCEHFSTGSLNDEHDCIKLIIDILKNSGCYVPTLREIETYDTILVLGENLAEVAPRLSLSVRQAMKQQFFKEENYNNIPKWHSQALLNISQNLKNNLFITSIDLTGLDDISTWSYCASVEEQISFAFGLANSIDDNSPIGPNIQQDIKNKIGKIKKIFLSSKKVLIISGVHSGSVNLIQAAFNIYLASKNMGVNVGLTLLTNNSNSIGVGLMQGMSLNNAFNRIMEKQYDAMIVMENDLYRYFTKKQLDMILNNISIFIILDYQNSNSVKKGHLVLSSANFFESSGTIINYESRAQRFFKVYDPKFYDNKVGKIESWKWLHYIDSKRNNCRVIWKTIDDIINNIIVDIPDFKNIKKVSPDVSFRVFGAKLARSPHRSSGRTALRANISVHEPKQPQDQDSFFTFSMEGNQQFYKFSSYIPFAWSPGWNSPQAWNKFQKTINHSLLKGDSGVRIFCKKKVNMSWFQFKNNVIKHNVDNYQIVPYYYLFGTEEITQKNLIFKKKISLIRGVINFLDAKKNYITEHSIVEFVCLNTIFHIKFYISKKLSPGYIGLPLGALNIPLILSGKIIENLREIST